MNLELPDEPRWIEAHGIAADPAGWRRELDGGFAVGHDTARLVVIAGGDSAQIAVEYPQHTILATTDELADALRSRGRTPVRAILHTLPEPDALPELEGAVVLPGDADLSALPAPLLEELAVARTHGPIWTVYLEGAPVSFAYAPWRSARWFDVSIDTIAAARQLGLATITAAAMIRHERAAGREPVWGADEGNIASIGLARRLGFTAVDEIWVAPPR